MYELLHSSMTTRDQSLTDSGQWMVAGLHTGFFSGGGGLFYSYLGQFQLKDLPAI